MHATAHGALLVAAAACEIVALRTNSNGDTGREIAGECFDYAYCAEIARIVERGAALGTVKSLGVDAERFAAMVLSDFGQCAEICIQRPMSAFNSSLQ